MAAETNAETALVTHSFAIDPVFAWESASSLKNAKTVKIENGMVVDAVNGELDSGLKFLASRENAGNFRD